MHSNSRTPTSNKTEKKEESTTTARIPSPQLTSSCGRLVLQFSAMRDLHVMKRVNTELKKLSDNEAVKRSGLIYKTDEKQKNSEISQIRIFNQKNSKRATIEVASKRGLRTLSIENKITVFGAEFFSKCSISKNDLGIKTIDMGGFEMSVSFSNDQPSLALHTRSTEETDTYAPNAQQCELIKAVSENKVELASSLLKSGISANTRDQEGVPLLIRAAIAGDTDMVKLLVQHHASLEARSPKNGQTALLAAGHKSFDYELRQPSKKHEETVVFLVEQGANINAQSSTGRTLLHYLLTHYCDRSNLIRFLLTRGANPTILDLYDKRPTDNTDYRRNPKNAHPLYAHCMQMDAKPHVQSCSYEAPHYKILFKPDAWTIEIVNAWEAIVNKLKSLKVNDPDLKNPDDALGLASNITVAHFEDRGGQVADVPIPHCRDYAINSFMYFKEKNSIEIEIKEKYLNNVNVHNTIREALANLELRFEEKATSSLEKTPNSISASGMFSGSAAPDTAAALNVNKRNIHTLYKSNNEPSSETDTKSSESKSKRPRTSEVDNLTVKRHQ